jgi:hypothetical protein
MVATPAVRNANEAMVRSVRVRVWWKSGVRRSVLCSYVLHEFGISRRKDFFSSLIHFIKKFYKFCNFNDICKNNAQMNVNNFHQISFVPVDYDGLLAPLLKL